MKKILVKPVKLPSGRRQTPSKRALKAVEIYAGNGRSKADALRQAGFSASVVDAPSKVFGSPTIQALMEELGVGDGDALKAIKRNVVKRHLENMTFPPYNPEKALDRTLQEQATGEDLSEKIRGEQLTDEQIRDMFSELGIVVKNIVHGSMVRYVYFWTDDSKAQLSAADMILNITGGYAPKKVAGKFDHRVGVFSMKELRDKMRKEGIAVLPDNQNQ